MNGTRFLGVSCSKFCILPPSLSMLFVDVLPLILHIHMRQPVLQLFIAQPRPVVLLIFSKHFRCLIYNRSREQVPGLYSGIP